MICYIIANRQRGVEYLCCFLRDGRDLINLPGRDFYKDTYEGK